MNLRSGVDTDSGDFFLLGKLNIPSDERDAALRVLKAIEAVCAEKLSSDRTHGSERNPDGTSGRPRTVVGDFGLTLQVAFGLRFFLGPLDRRRPEEPVQNFPP
ncbi:MAG: hypothetical protein ABI837_19070, partial [Acidobacteriota bacterium]